MQGIGAASPGSLNVILIEDFFTGKDRPKAMDFNASVLSLTTTLFPLIGGIMIGVARHYPFLLPLLGIPIDLFVIFSLPEPEFIKTSGFLRY
jgi:MFS transporter, ACDE family, multidrug resistance protein